ncbi:MAG TPA: hypothetical protein PKA82_10885 [Pyrinomonadaceae bacterium]|nr:hypothetical protein [Pyrinomonadaceae bacterium]
MKNFTLIAAVAIFAAFISACGGAANTNNAAKPASPAAASPAKSAEPATKADAPASADGQVIKIDEAGIQVTAPKGWKFEKDGEDTVIKSADEEIDFRFSVPADGDYEAAVKGAAKELDSYLKNVKIDNPGSETKVDGMDARGMAGNAKKKGGDGAGEPTRIKSPKKPVFVKNFTNKNALQKHEKETKALLESVKKM